MAAGDPLRTPNPRIDWYSAFAELHREWGIARTLPGYSKRSWVDRLELLELQAALAGYVRPVPKSRRK
jgi:hypothetical protein